MAKKLNKTKGSETLEPEDGEPIPDDERTEGPEWDQERWKHDMNEEDEERPEWDDERWKAAAASQDSAVDEIVRGEGDKAIKSEDDAQKEVAPIGFWAKTKAGFASWWNNPKARYSTLGGLTAVVLLILLIPGTRYGVLNSVGVRASAKVTVLDEETQLPLKNVNVELSNETQQTDEYGVASFNSVNLGSQELNVTKTAYGDYFRQVNIGTGENVLDSVPLVSIGTQFKFQVNDWLSDEAIEGAEAASGENSAYSDEFGRILLSVPPTEEDMLSVTVSAKGYLEQEVSIDPLTKNVTNVKLVVAEPDYFVSKRHGQYDLYKINADGSNEQMIIEGTGEERDDIRFSVAPNNKRAMLVATRTIKKNDQGYLLRGLYLIDLEEATIEKIDESERIDMVGWIDDSLIYVKVAAGASGGNPDRHRLVSFDSLSKQSQQLASSNYFNDVLVTEDHVFYAPSDVYRENPKPFLFKTTVDAQQETVFDKEVWTVLRKDFSNILFDNNQDWYKSTIESTNVTKQDNPPKTFVSRIYTVSPDEKMAVWADQRDGKGVLLAYNTETGEEKVLHKQGGLRNPLRWLSNSHVIFRIVSDNETADYVINIYGGEARKITDLSNVSGYDRWYYYY